MERTEIEKIIEEIQNTNLPDKVTHFEKKYPEFRNKYENLFKVACSRKIDKNMLNYMFDLKDKINAKEIDQFSASAKVGTCLYDKYINPKITNLPPTKK